MIETVHFKSRGRDAVLEGELFESDGRPCLVSHPHPLAGGDMHHPIADAVWRAAGAAGLRALRYNFRGVGGSQGALSTHASLALDDLGGALDFLGANAANPALAIGYSYGARVTLHSIFADEPIERAALIALPTRLPINRAAMSNLLLGRRVRTEEYTETPDVDLAPQAPKPIHVFAGDHDPLVIAGELEQRGVSLTLFAGVNHFFSRKLGNQAPDKGDLDALSAAVLRFLAG